MQVPVNSDMHRTFDGLYAVRGGVFLPSVLIRSEKKKKLKNNEFSFRISKTI